MKLAEIGRGRLPEGAGGKAEGLHWLASNGHPIPKTWLIPWTALAGLDDERAERLVREALAPVVRPDVTYAVRSSADVEDGDAHSYAGQFDTLLDLKGLDEVAAGVMAVRTRERSARLEAYTDSVGATDDESRMAVVVQEMVPSVASGVAFSADPLTGMPEIVVEAVTGQGDRLVQDGVTPYRWRRARVTWREVPPSSPIELGVVEQVADAVAAMAARRKTPVDVEWAWDGSSLYFLQLRPITGLDDVVVYSSRIARDMLPGVIPPLVWSVNVPLVAGQFIEMAEQVLGPVDLRPEELVRAFYHHAYFNMTAIGGLLDRLDLPPGTFDSMWLGEDAAASVHIRPPLNAHMLALVPRLLAFALRMLGLRRRAERELPRLEARLDAFLEGPPATDLTAPQVLERIDELMPIVADAIDLGKLVPMASAMRTRLFVRTIAPLAIDPERVDFENHDTGAEGRDPGTALAHLHEIWSELPSGTRDAVATGKVARLRATSTGVEFLRQVDEFLAVYGHFSDSGTDFSVAPWREDLPMVLRMIANTSAPAQAEGRLGRKALEDAGASRRALRQWRLARRWQVLRERTSAFYTRAYGELRPLYLRLGDILFRRGALQRADEVFLLARDELLEALEFGAFFEEVPDLVATRAAELASVADVSVPEIIVGDVAPPLRAPTGDTHYGTAASRGIASGRVVRAQSIEDAQRVAAGCVLVVPYADVSWTTLFGKASAVVAESGGFLSHCAIVAREHGIPAVVSVEGAMAWLRNGDVVTVDGGTGTVTRTAEARSPDETAAAAS